jgi:C-terminal processing protease CtpA/Prc
VNHIRRAVVYEIEFTKQQNKAIGLEIVSSTTEGHVAVGGVSPGSLAEEFGVLRGDVVVSIQAPSTHTTRGLDVASVLAALHSDIGTGVLLLW